MTKFLLYIALSLLFFLKTFSQSQDSIIVSKSLSNFNIYPAAIDTSIVDFNIHNPAQKQSVSNTFLGNLGQEAISNQLNLKLLQTDFFFLNPFNLYYPNDFFFFNTRKPFTLLNYTGGGNKEYSLGILHTQNVNKNLNIGFQYNLINSLGQYLRQTTKNFSINFFSAYSNHRYSLFAELKLIRINLHQSGGITNDAFVTDSSGWETAGMTVWLSDAFSKINTSTMFLSQEMKIGKANKTFVKDTIVVKSLKSKFSLIHNLDFSTNYRIYSEDNTDSTLYDVLFRYDKTKDSINLLKLNNFIGIKINNNSSNKFQLIAGFTNQFRKYFNSYFYYYATDTQFVSNGLKGQLNISKSEKFNICIQTEYTISGYYKDNVFGNLLLKKQLKTDTSFIYGNLSFKTITPDFLEQHCISNHFIRDENFTDKQITNLRTGYNNSKLKFNLEIDYYLLDNHVYFNSEMTALQEKSTFQAFMISLDKNFSKGKFHFNNTMFYQESGNQKALSLPKILLKHTIFWKFPVNFKVTGGYMDLISGIELRYNSNFYAMGYSPALGSFYNQEEKLLGNYPYIDLFINIKLKRSRFFFKMEHLNEGLLNPNYFLALHYPANIRVFKFGISWSFYD
ncbi:MAG: hypothetical protein JXR58_06980 [Bacteroidales bacterium]|nr:hypothetical protein [Bacteroidales bacterium]